MPSLYSFPCMPPLHAQQIMTGGIPKRTFCMKACESAYLHISCELPSKGSLPVLSCRQIHPRSRVRIRHLERLYFSHHAIPPRTNQSPIGRPLELTHLPRQTINEVGR